MTGTLFVKADGTSCGASMVKRVLILRVKRLVVNGFHPQQHKLPSAGRQWWMPFIGFFSMERSAAKLCALPLADPSTPSVIPKWEKSTLRYQCIDLCPNRCCFRRAEVIIYYDPATVGE